MQYTEKAVTLSKNQVHKLSKGKKVRLPYKALSGGPIKLFLTPQQLRKVETRLKNGVGMDIGPFDEAQIKHNMQHGGSLWDSLKQAGKFLYDNVVKPGAQFAYEEIGRPLLDEAKREGVKYLISEGRTRAKNYFGKGHGVGMAKRGRKPIGKKGQRGDGFFDDIGDFFTKTVPSVATTVYNDAIKPASQVLLPIGKEIAKTAWDERDTLIPIAVEMAKAGAGVKRRGKAAMIGSKYRKRPLGAGLKRGRKQLGASFRLP